MALSPQHRTTIYRKLAPILGDAETEALMKELPIADHEKPATSGFVNTEISKLTSAMYDTNTRTMYAMVWSIVGGMALVGFITR